jgi:hypothetical protein
MSGEEIEKTAKSDSINYYKLIEEWKPLEDYIVTVERKKSIKAKKLLQEIANAKKKETEAAQEAAESGNKTPATADKTSTTADTQSESGVSQVDVAAAPATTGTSVTTKKAISKRSSFFAFNFLKKEDLKKQTKLNLIRQNSIGEKERREFAFRKDSSTSNDVFMEEAAAAAVTAATSNASPSAFSMLTFSTKNLFSRLMLRGGDLLEEPLNESSIANQTILSEHDDDDDELQEMAKEIVGRVLAEARDKASKLEQQQQQQQQQQPTASTVKSNEDVSIKSETSVYLDTKTYFSNAPSSIDMDESFQDMDNTSSDIDLHDMKSSKSTATINDQQDQLPQHHQVNESQSSQSLKIKAQFSAETIEAFALNMHRIDKDVTRCDRNYWYFMANENLQKLKNIMYTYVKFISTFI